jgi:hypothetical protein
MFFRRKKPAAPQNAVPPPRTSSALEPGDVMPDGTVYAGVSPDTGKPLFALPQDAPAPLHYTQALPYAEKLNRENAHGHGDWRPPSKRERDLLLRHMRKGALKGTFNEKAAYLCLRRLSSRPAYPGCPGEWAVDCMEINLYSRFSYPLRCVRSA